MDYGFANYACPEERNKKKQKKKKKRGFPYKHGGSSRVHNK